MTIKPEMKTAYVMKMIDTIEASDNLKAMWIGELEFEEYTIDKYRYSIEDETEVIISYGACRCTFSFDEEYILKVDFDNNNYTKGEYDNWKYLKNTSVAEAFAPIGFLGTIMGRDVYIMEKVSNVGYEVIEDRVYHLVDDEDEGYEYCEDQYLLVETLFKDAFGLDFANAVNDEITFLNIDDIHTGNVGLTDNNIPVIFDYAGFAR